MEIAEKNENIFYVQHNFFRKFWCFRNNETKAKYVNEQDALPLNLPIPIRPQSCKQRYFTAM
jgi:hypothetical protein